MKITFFKISAVLSILGYMAVKIVIFYLYRLFKPAKADNWLSVNLLKWAFFCIKKIKAETTLTSETDLQSIDWKRNVFIVSNHQSYADIPVLIHSFQKTVGFVAKKELGAIPFLNYWMKKIGCVLINRKNYPHAIRTLKKLEKSGTFSHLVVFPEGTRGNSDKMGPFKNGVLKMAWSADALIVPVYISGSRNGWEDKSQIKENDPISLHVFNPIDLLEIKSQKTFEQFFSELEYSFQKMEDEMPSLETLTVP
jgi:DNA helicase II / ATP-dependent DNA helicase PcrA